ncbi:hypothetical protein CL65_gp056 [Mycobacterium phage Patience]|uniref:Uncharacterized protein n=1 Tax=Mycobacterium phage Patience TaxID=1074308 RepID=G1JWG6_9CAUD|nr:hypothetical protein CL65_gp056 [Mycobacterium phage Patience]AEL97964.1 hypothetical protein PATIENCE_55 [Mycobacterium phage Patience]
MPGPMSAPNGNAMLTYKPRDPHTNVRTGKTDLKRGKIRSAKSVTEENRMKKKLSRARREQLEAD